MIEFNFTRRQSETSLSVAQDGSPVNSAELAPKHLFGLRKPVQRSVTYTPRDVAKINKPKEQVSLPDRFRWKVRRKSIPSSMAQSIGVLGHISEEGDLEFSDHWIDRKNDMEQAIKWLRQELTTMKRQDRVLKKRLLDLEATIHHLRGIRSCPSLVQSQSSLYSGPSWLSLDDGSTAVQGDTAAARQQQRDTVTAFRARMLAEFQKSRPNLYLQSRTVSLLNMKGGSGEDFASLVQTGPGSVSSGGSAFLTSCSSFSGEEDGKSDRGLRQQESLDSLAFSMLSESLEEIPDQEEEEVKPEELHKVFLDTNSSATCSSDEEDADQSDGCESYEDSTLTRDTNTDKNLRDSLEDILTAVSTREEREGLADTEQLVFAV